MQDPNAGSTKPARRISAALDGRKRSAATLSVNSSRLARPCRVTSRGRGATYSPFNYDYRFHIAAERAQAGPHAQ